MTWRATRSPAPPRVTFFARFLVSKNVSKIILVVGARTYMLNYYRKTSKNRIFIQSKFYSNSGLKILASKLWPQNSGLKILASQFWPQNSDFV